MNLDADVFKERCAGTKTVPNGPDFQFETSDKFIVGFGQKPNGVWEAAPLSGNSYEYACYDPGFLDSFIPFDRVKFYATTGTAIFSEPSLEITRPSKCHAP